MCTSTNSLWNILLSSPHLCLQKLQRWTTAFDGLLFSSVQRVRLTISIKKTEVLAQNSTSPPAIKILDSTLAVVDSFKYLGSTISSNLSLDDEIKIRIGKAATVMSKLNTRVWNNKNLTLKTKIKVYHACVLSTLLYGSETWTTYAKQEHQMNAFHLRCLRRIMGYTWRDKIQTTMSCKSPIQEPCTRC